jgi:hypothetical protein
VAVEPKTPRVDRRRLNRRGAGIEPDMLQSPEFGDVVTEAALVAIVKQRENPSDFCEATWKLFGPGGALRWQMLEAN